MGKIIIRAKPIKPKTSSSPNNEMLGSDDTGEGDGGDGGGGKDGKGNGDGKGGKGASSGGTGGGGMQKKTAEINNVRAIVMGSRNRKISLTPTVTGDIAISLLEAGADSDYNIHITKSDMGEIKNGSVVVSALAEKRITLNIELCEEYNRALKVVAYEI